MGGAGVRLRTTTSVSQPRCLLKGASGHPPRRVVVALVDGDVIEFVSFCDGNCRMEGSRGIERVRHAAINAKSGRICGIMFDG